VHEPARDLVVDGAGGDRQHRGDAGDRHGAHEPEHHPGPEKTAPAPTTTLQAALPPWLKASFRPMRRAKAAEPTTPSVIAATVGGNTAADAPDTACIAATGQKPGASGMSRQVAVTSAAAPATSARLARSLSTSTPMGVCARRPAMAAAESATPMLASSQACRSSRYTARYAPSP
jgi:hypothetical protein